MNPIEGITPSTLWIFLEVLVGLAALFILYDKIVDIYYKRKKRKMDADEERSGTVHDRLINIEERLDSIDEKLDRDKRRLEALEKKQDDASDGFRALCTASLALLNHAIHNGNSDEMEDAQKELITYLKNR